MQDKNHHYKLGISYKGSNYFGWQDLGSSESKPTVQATIQQVLKKICKYKDCTISAASRTDAGVHAQGQVAKISLPVEIDSQKLLRGMNSLLPVDIRIVECETCPAEFNPNRNTLSKEYHYYFSLDPVSNPVLNDIVVPVYSDSEKASTIPAQRGDKGEVSAGEFDLNRMKEACKLFLGEHDFYSFAARDANISITVRSIFVCEILSAEFSTFTDEVYYLKIAGDGFLKQMIRYIVGALFAVGRGTLDLGEISDALENHRPEKLQPKAKARGLHLMRINYPK